MEENKEKNVDNQQNAGGKRDFAKDFGISDEGMTEEQQEAFAKLNKSAAVADDITDIFNDDKDISVNIMMVAFGIFIKRVEDAIDMEKYDREKKRPNDTPLLEMLRIISDAYDGYKKLDLLKKKFDERFGDEESEGKCNDKE